MIKYCVNCGKLLREHARFCTVCGFPVRGADPAPVEQPQNTQPEPTQVQEESFDAAAVDEAAALEKVYTLEQSLYVQREVLKQLNQRSSRLCLLQRFEKPVPPSGVFHPAATWTISALVAGAIGLLAALQSDLASQNLYFPLFGLLFGAVIGGGCHVLIQYINYRLAMSEKRGKYTEDLRKYNFAVENETFRIKRESEEKNTLLSIIARLTQQRQGEEALLRDAYEKNVVSPQYQNLAALCALHDLISTDQCATLDGPEGAYSKFDSMARAGQICADLQSAVQNLEQLKETQPALFTALDSGDKEAQTIVEIATAVSKKEAASEPALAAYFQRTDAQNGLAEKVIRAYIQKNA